MKSIRDDSGFEIAWVCDGCDQVVTSAWGDLCYPCHDKERRHRELIRAIRESKNAN